MKIIRAGLVFAMLVISVCATASAKTPPRTSAVAGIDTPLQVWSRKDQRAIDEATFIKRIARSRFVLLGEVHDNPLHHRLRGHIVSKIHAHRKTVAPTANPPAAVFEHASTGRQSRFDVLTGRLNETQEASAAITPDDMAEFFKAADWTSRGWPKSDLFGPLVQAVLSARMPLYAGDVPRQRMMSVARGSSTPQSEALAETEIARLALDIDLGAANNEAALSEIGQAHCGVMPKSMLGPMAYAQRLRDATLADTMIKAARKHGSAVLFAGNGHVRDDRAAPWYLRIRTGQLVISVLFKERALETPQSSSAEPGGTTQGADPATPSVRHEAEQVADYVVWTPARKRPDACQKLREKYGKTKR